jgi:CHC2 zinc finger/Toprim-like
MTENRPFLDFKSIKARASISSILDRYGVKLNRVNQATLKGNCPLPSHSSKTKNTFYASEVKSAWYCHSDSCKKNGRRAGGNVIDFVAAMESLSIYAAAARIDEMFPATGNPAGNVVSNIPGRADHEVDRVAGSPAEEPGESCNKPLGFALKDVSPAHPMIQGRGISVETARRFGIGFFPGKGSMVGRVVFSLYENGELIGYAGRTTLPVSDENPKWMIGKGLKKTFLYGLERCDPAKPLILVESFWGPPFFYEKGLQAASLMGAELTERQERCLDSFPVIIVALDNDALGIEKAARIRERLKGNHRVLKARLVE